jgi:uncharacterized protein YegL
MDEYTQPATSDTPAHILYLLDVSGTMKNDLEGRPRIKWLEDALEYTLDYLIDQRSYDGEVYRPRYKIAIVTYSNRVDDSLTDGEFVDVKDFWNEGLPEFSPSGETFTKGAFEYAYRMLKKLLKDPTVQEKCPAPVVCHVTDGQYNIGGDPTAIASKIKGLRNRDGYVLVQNLFVKDDLLTTPIKDASSWTGFMPEDVETAFKSKYAHTLFNMSSSLPESYAGVLADADFNLAPGSRMMYPGQNYDLIKLAFVASTATRFL